MVEIKVGRRTYEMKFISWSEGAAMTCIDVDHVVSAPAKERARVFSWNPKTGAINRWHGEQKRAET
jgi:hypothetical protein